MNQNFRAYRHADESLGFYGEESEREARANGLLGESDEFLFEVQAATWDDAMTIYRKRMGFDPYKPL